MLFYWKNILFKFLQEFLLCFFASDVTIWDSSDEQEINCVNESLANYYVSISVNL